MRKPSRDAFWGMAGLLTVFAILAILGMPLLVVMMASGFVGDDRFDLAGDDGPDRLSLYPLHLADCAFVGMLNAAGRFVITSAVTLLLSAT